MTLARSYDKLAVEPFGARLLETEDLDPVYVALVRADLDRALLLRWLVAYWCCYDSGVSSWIAEQDDFWGAMMTMAVNTTPTLVGPRWSRGRERRHFRGVAAIMAVDEMRGRYPLPEQLVYRLHRSTGGAVPYAEVRAHACHLPLFGPWIAFKIADMLDRVLGWPVNFATADVLMFAEPRKAALMLWRQTVPPPGHTTDNQAVSHIAAILVGHFQQYPAPPRYERPVNIQEVETILCKWKGHQAGHYPVGNDLADLRASLGPWTTHSPTAARLFAATPLVPVREGLFV